MNISVAIISMRREFGWNQTVAGVVQSSFFAGYMFTQIPGGYIVGRLGGRRVLPAGVTMWSSATAITPLLAGSLPGAFPFALLFPGFQLSPLEVSVMWQHTWNGRRNLCH